MFRRKTTTVFFCFILLLSAAVPAMNSEAAGSLVKISVDELNVRSGPGLSYPILGKASRNEEFKLLGQENEWQEISYNGESGWVADWLVTSANEPSSQSNHYALNSGQATITEDGLRVRSAPGTNNSVIGTVHKGETYRIVNRDGDWTQLETSYGLGWVFNDYLQSASGETEESPTSNDKKGAIIGSSLNVRSNPSTNADILGKLDQGSTVKILSESNGWIEISYSGQSAWISSEFVETSSGSSMSTSTAEPVSNKLASGNTAIIKADSLTVRDTPSLNGNQLGKVTKGETFTMLEERSDWVKIEFKDGSYGWVAGWFLEKQNAGSTSAANKPLSGSTVSITHDGTNIRSSASTSSDVVYRANTGQVFEAISLENDWYEIKLEDGSTGFVAGWIVTVNGQAPQIEKRGSGSIKNKTIVIDPGHGGRDNGTTGTRGTLEKKLNLQTAELLAAKLKRAGANVVLTRNSDTYIPLESRVRSSVSNGADAFISIHYDSITDRSVRGMTTYYHHAFQENLAEDVHAATAARTRLKDRGHRQGDYYVIRENSQKAILIELGYLSNPTEEMAVSSPQYQEAAATGMYEGLVRYFK